MSDISQLSQKFVLQPFHIITVNGNKCTESVPCTQQRLSVTIIRDEAFRCYMPPMINFEGDPKEGETWLNRLLESSRT
jgi:hypothetical protein